MKNYEALNYIIAFDTSYLDYRVAELVDYYNKH
ncbi:hypothetical protein Pan161_04320 [Gimesia algae]|uniref:Uncharacterized protein n=1 Tax=Gimesia algae TaxID=2527971 RepID=A0A517V743_9PLAN|nr:hypothetical protein Pan161_04320 [Gimesia algae]